MAEKPAEYPVVVCEDQAAFEHWLANHHEAASGVSGVKLKIAKKDSGFRSVSYKEALEAALCYGWIDGRKEALDSGWWLQTFTPRRQGSIWSAVNKAKAEELTAAGRMKPAGFRAIEAAKQSGQWENAYKAQSAADIPEDFAAALEQNAAAKANFDALDKKNKYAFLFRIQNANKPETRAKRIASFISMLEQGEKIYP